MAPLRSAAAMLATTLLVAAPGVALGDTRRHVLRPSADAALTATGAQDRHAGAVVVRGARALLMRFDLHHVGTRLSRARLVVWSTRPRAPLLAARVEPSAWRRGARIRRPFVRGRRQRGQRVAFDVTRLVQGRRSVDLVVATRGAPTRVATSEHRGAGAPRLAVELAATADLEPPVRAAFYWLDENASARGSPGAGRRPVARARFRRHVKALVYGGFDAAIASWTRFGGAEDRRFRAVLGATRNSGTGLRWALYYQKEATGDPSSATIGADLRRIARVYGGDPAYLRLGGRPVVFAAATGDDCSMSTRWGRAAGDRVHVMLKVVAGFRLCSAQPQGWFQYAPEVARSSQNDHYYAVSPGHHRVGEAAPRLARDVARFRTDVQAMVASGEPWQLITSFNGWREGSAVESGGDWRSPSGHGLYLDVLHELLAGAGAPAPLPVPGPAPPAPAPTRPLPTPTSPVDIDAAVVMAAGDIACSPHDGSFNQGAGTPTACRQGATSDLLVAHRPAAVLTLGDNQYPAGALADFLVSYDLSWGRLKAITRPAPGNHDYGLPGAVGYFDYFNGVGVLDGLAGGRTTGYYSFDVGRWHLIALNSSCDSVGGCGVSSRQTAWLRADLAGHRDGCVLAYWHHPRFSSGQHGNQETLRPIFQALYDAGAEVVLAGHDHNYERFAPQDAAGRADPVYGIRQFVVGTGGVNLRRTSSRRVANSEVFDDDTYGVIRLTLHPDRYDWEFLPVPGGSFTDAGSGACHPAP